ncbi:MAG: 2-dehydro-3-deoxygalactonokinase [Clostridia bacterium]|nr:2-dehydro-3-deoxygalactonokinase [Clostridia bacterium]MBQ6858201.1 2-dehydro-3-deoxygalactonokinase [Clostridia bacterium]MBQ7051929.1 2-dehydro-3-deoxygalactonokinase [Clostridia bacterium]
MSRCYLVVDCGTTNLRVTLLNENKEKIDTVKAEGGVRHTSIDGHNGRLRTMLRESIETVLARNGYTAADVEKCVASGMITSALGLMEIPHVPAPAGAAELREKMQEKVFEDVAPFPIAFIPGMRNFAGPVDLENFSGMDMMRGEEVEAVGLYKLLAPKGAAMFVLPGTHNKFVAMDAQGRMLGCMTSISGELLDALTHHTIIAEAVGHSFVSADEYDPEYAKAGARECAVSGLGRAAFAGRILSTLGGKDRAKLQSYLLGATLALDVQAMQSFVGDQENVEAYIAGKAPLQQCFCDVMEALAAGEAHQVAAEVSGRMGLEGVLEIAF